MILAWLRTYAATLLAAVALAGWGAAAWQQLRFVNLQRDMADQRGIFLEMRLLALSASARQEADARAEDQRRVAAIQEAADAAEKQADQARAELALADAAAGRLRERIAALVASARQAARDPAATQPGPPAEDAPGMLADVLGRCITRVRDLAELADARGTAGAACERSYGALIQAELF